MNRKAIDLNCDMGEGAGNDESIMPFISSANIACGYHAGDETIIRNTIALAIKYGVAVGAHVSFADKENFGRREQQLSPVELHELVTHQLIIIKEIADALAVKIDHVKPHGALYNMSARDALLAKAIAVAVKDFDERLVLFGLSGSHSISEARSIGLPTAQEVFADRVYQEDGSLTPRSVVNALIEDSGQAVQQVMQMIKEGRVTTASGKTVSVMADTICIHGDGRQAAVFAKHIYEILKQNNIDIQAI